MQICSLGVKVAGFIFCKYIQLATINWELAIGWNKYNEQKYPLNLINLTDFFYIEMLTSSFSVSLTNDCLHSQWLEACAVYDGKVLNIWFFFFTNNHIVGLGASKHNAVDLIDESFEKLANVITQNPEYFLKYWQK